MCVATKWMLSGAKILVRHVSMSIIGHFKASCCWSELNRGFGVNLALSSEAFMYRTCSYDLS